MHFKTKIINYVSGNVFFWSLVATVVFVATFYVYAVNQTIVMVAQRDAVESKILAYRTTVSKLQSTYISEMNGITMELALSMGYGEAQQVVYAPIKSVSLLTKAEQIPYLAFNEEPNPR